MRAPKTDSFLLLSKEELIEKLLKSEREIAVQHDLLKQTFIQNKGLQNKYADVQRKLREQSFYRFHSSDKATSRTR